jgi:integrase
VHGLHPSTVSTAYLPYKQLDTLQSSRDNPRVSERGSAVANKKVSLIYLCKTDTGWKRYPAVYGGNGRVRPGVVMVDGKERQFPTGRYQLRTYQGSRMVYEDAGAAADAPTNLKATQNKLITKSSAKVSGDKIQEEPDRLNLRRELIKFTEIVKDRGSDEASRVYQASAEDFLFVTGRTYADEIVPEDITRYQRELRKRKLADRTIYNRHQQLMPFLRHLKLDVKALSPTKPRYEEALPEIYSPELLVMLFTSLHDDQQTLTYELLLKAGLREQEAIYLMWKDVDLKRGVLRVRSKPEYEFKVKDKEQRDIPLPPDLIAKLKARHDASPHRKLVLGTSTDKPNMKMLRTLKRAVKNAGMNCDSCKGCLSKAKECEQWFLHKFRATYITTLLRSGMDLRTVMKLSGHSDLESVMRYLSPATDDAIKQHISAVAFM